MEQLNTGTIGAKVQSWRTPNPRDLLKAVLDENPGADRSVIFRLFRERLREEEEGEDFIEVIIEYWLANNYYSLVGPTRPVRRRASHAAEVTSQASQIRDRVRQKLKETAKIVLLDMMMPNGKALKDCSGKECRELSIRVGDWLGEVAKRVKARQMVGDVWSEEDLLAIY